MTLKVEKSIFDKNKNRLIFIIIATAIVTIGLFVTLFILSSQKLIGLTYNNVLDIKKANLINKVDNMVYDIDLQRERLKEENPYWTEEQINEEVEHTIYEKIHKEKIDDDAYIWIEKVLDYDGGDNFAIRLMYPNVIEMEGKYISTDMTDGSGNYIYRTQLDEVKEKGSALMSYKFKKIDENKVTDKITYSRLYKDYNWIVTMTVNVDELNTYTVGLMHSTLVFRIGMMVVLFIIYLFMLAVTWYVIRSADKQHYEKQQGELKKRINWDRMTSANSRAYGEELLKGEFNKFNSGIRNTAIMMMDVDNFKGFNDTYGHEIGDKVLRQVVVATRKLIRSSDSIIRWGGDEFVGIFCGLTPRNLDEFMNKLLKGIRDIDIVVGDDHIHVTVSIGFSYLKNIDNDYKDVIRRADEALYMSKQAGRDRATLHK